MMSELSIILWLLLFAAACVGQDNLSNNSDKDTLRYKRFDTEEYKRLVRKNPTAYRIRKEGKLGELIELSDEYVNNSFAGFRESHTYRDSPYEYIYLYNTAGNITTYCAYLYQVPAGKGYQFDGHGHEMECVDYDLPYKFSIDSLKVKMLHQYGTNLMDKKEVFSVRRYEEREYIKRPIYIVYARWKDNRNDIYLINGTNGKTLYTQKAVKIVRDDSPTDWKSIEELYHNSKSYSSIPIQQ